MYTPALQHTLSGKYRFKNKSEIKKFQAKQQKFFLQNLKMLVAERLSSMEITKDILQAEGK